MQKLRSYVLPGLFLFHLVLLCVMLLTGPTDVAEPTPLQELYAFTFVTIVFSQFFLTALWAGLGAEPWALRIPGCAALAALAWTSLSIWMERLVSTSWSMFGNADFYHRLLSFPNGPITAWAGLAGVLLCMRIIPFPRWRLIHKPTTPVAIQNTLPNYSLTRGILIVVTTWGGVLMLLKNSFQWSEFQGVPSMWGGRLTAPETLKELGLLGGVLGAMIALFAMICVGLTLTRLADWIFYRRRWTLPLLVTVVLGGAISLLMMSGSTAASFPGVVYVSLLLAAQPLTTLLVMGMAGYRLAPRKSERPFASRDPSGQDSGVAKSSSVDGLSIGVRGAHIAALAALLVLFCTVVPTGFLRDHKINLISHDIKKNHVGEIIDLQLGAYATDTGVALLVGRTNLQRLNLAANEFGGGGTKITDAGLVHLKGMTSLEELDLSCTKITDAGLMHLQGLTKLQDLNLASTQVTGAGLVHLQELTSLKMLDIGGDPFSGENGNIHNSGLVHLKLLANLQDLRLGSIAITDSGLVHLKGLNGLLRLNLSYTQITDAGLVHLEDLNELQDLFLSFTQITDAGLEHLKGLTGLKALVLLGTQVTEAGMAELKKALHDCKIYH